MYCTWYSPRTKSGLGTGTRPLLAPMALGTSEKGASLRPGNQAIGPERPEDSGHNYHMYVRST